jgi:hypothetical protein
MTCPTQTALTSSDWIAISSAAIAILAFFATAWQAWLAWVHNRLSVTPCITSNTDSTTTDNGLEVKLTVKNVGVGPALIDERYFEIDGQKFNPNGQDLVVAVCTTVFGNAFKYHIAQNGMFGGKATLPSGAEIVIARLVFPGLTPDAKLAIMGASSRANFVVKYKSLYGKKFAFTTAT